MAQLNETTALHPAVGVILKEITDVMASLDDSQSVLNALVRLVTQMLTVDRCSLMLIDPDAKKLRIRAAHGLNPEIVEKYRGKLGEGIAGMVALEGKPLLITDIENHPLFKRNSGREYTTTSLLSVPLLFHGNVIGVLNVNNKTDGTLLSESDELWLGTVANFIVISLEKARMLEVEADKKRIDADLNLAQEIQRSFLPSKFPSDEHFQYAAYCMSAYEVAGDFYDVIPLGDGTIALLMGDVCGKGVAAALYMARVISYFRAVASLRSSARGLMDGVNKFLSDEWSERSMVTACLAVINREESFVRIYNAGHLPPYHVIESTGEVRAIKFDHGFPLGVDGDTKYNSCDVPMKSGDFLILYTDGLTEALDPNGNLFGEKRLEKVLEGHEGHPEKLIGAIAGAVLNFAGGLQQKDDETLVVMRKT